MNTKITWAEAEQIYPGIEAEWRAMCGRKGDCVPPSGEEWRLEVHDWGTERVIYVIQLDPTQYWHDPPHWRRWPGGSWTHPYPMPLGFWRSVFFQELVVSNIFTSKNTEDGEQ
jgi:hypothetical protein